VIQNLSHSRRNLALAAFGILFLWFVWSIRVVVNPLLLGYLAAFILHPMVAKLEARGFKRGPAVGLTFAAWFIGAIVVFGGLFAQTSTLVTQVVEDDAMAKTLKSAVEDVRVRLDDVGITLPKLNVENIVEVTRNRLAAFTEIGGIGGQGSDEETGGIGTVGLKAAKGLGNSILGFLGALLGIGGMVFLVPLYAYYLLFHLGPMHTSIKRYLPKRDREKLANVGRLIGAMLASFFRGRLLVCLLKGIVLTIGLWALGVEYAFLFGMTGGLLSLIPVIGPFTGFLFAAVATIALHDHTWLSALLRTGLVFGAGELIEGYILMPKVIGDSLSMNEVEVLFYLLVGAASLGMLGMIIALPVAAAIKILLAEIVLPALRDFSDELEGSGSGG
jgi:predicted PurR-regulated permease PerM